MDISLWATILSHFLEQHPRQTQPMVSMWLARFQLVNFLIPGTTFAFRKRWGQIDWRSLGKSLAVSIHHYLHCVLCAASVDVDRIAREMDFQSLQQNIMNVTFCNIESEVRSSAWYNNILHIIHFIGVS